MGVTGEAPATVTGGLVGELKAKGQEKGEYAFDKRLAIAKQLHVGRFVLKIDGDSPVYTDLAVCASHGSPSGQIVGAADDPRWTDTFPIAR